MSKVTLTDHATILEGPDAVLLVKAAAIKSALGLAQKGIRINRAVGPQKLLEAASTITHKSYGRGKKACAQAIEDLQQWIVTMKAALPVVDERTKEKA